MHVTIDKMHDLLHCDVGYDLSPFEVGAKLRHCGSSFIVLLAKALGMINVTIATASVPMNALYISLKIVPQWIILLKNCFVS